MKRTILTVFLAVLILPFLAVAISPTDLDLPAPGVLPSNPFYFFKEWKRGLKRTLTFNSIKTARLELDILNERAAEISKLTEVMPNNDRILKASIDNYRADLRRFQLMEKLTGDIIFQHLKHIQLFSVIEGDFAVETKKELIIDLNELLSDNISVQEFRKLLNEKNRNNKQAFGGLMMASAVEQLNNDQLVRIKDDLLIDFLGEWMAREYSDDVFKTNNQSLTHLIRVLDELRFKIGDREVKSRLNILRQHFFKSTEGRQLKSEVGKMIQELKSSTDQTSFYIKQAERFYGEEQYQAALGQVSMGAATVANSQPVNYQEEIEVLKKYYDWLSVDDEELEKQIIELADRIGRRRATDTNSRLEQLLIDVKLKLAIAKYDIGEN